MRSSFYYHGHYRDVAEKVKDYSNALNHELDPENIDDTRASGGAIESLILKEFDTFLGDWCAEYKNKNCFSRRAMEDLAFTDKEGFYSAIDVKTHREDTKFNMPNLTSVEKLEKFYKLDTNAFSLLMVKYAIDGTRLKATKVIFSPIEYLDWKCLTVGALGWGQLQIADSNNIKINHRYSRKKWMLQLCDAMSDFYPKEIQKIKKVRMGRFENAKAYWESKEDVWD